MVKVKVCGITTPADAVWAAAAGADAIGINFYAPSRRSVSMEVARSIANAVPRGVCRVGVFVDAPRQYVQELAEELRFDAVQFHGSEPPEYCLGWNQKVIKAVRLASREDAERAMLYSVDFILADAYVEGLVGGTGQRVNWEWLSGIGRDRLILAGGLTPENVAEAIRRVRPAAVDVASGVESAPGIKDPERVRKFIANVQAA